LNQDGEPPKIFPYIKFDINRIIGNVDRDENGVPIVKRGANGQFKDKDGNLINPKGYLIDHKGNVIDRNGDRVIRKEDLD
jgi:hypothetical protein